MRILTKESAPIKQKTGLFSAKSALLGPFYPPFGVSLADDLVQTDPGGHGDVEAGHLASHWQADHVVAAVDYLRPEALLLDL